MIMRFLRDLLYLGVGVALIYLALKVGYGLFLAGDLWQWVISLI